MKRIAQLVGAACLAFGCAGTMGAAAVAEPVAQDLQSLRVPGRVASVLWTRRSDRYTLQVVFFREFRIAGNIAPTAAGKTGPGQINPRVQVWLLKSDGTSIQPSGRSTPSVGEGGIPSESTYSFSLPGGTEAAAVAISVDDAYYIQKLGTSAP